MIKIRKQNFNHFLGRIKWSIAEGLRYSNLKTGAYEFSPEFALAIDGMEIRNTKLAFLYCIWAELSDCFSAFVCVIKDHEYFDADPGNPENGPDPDVYCTRCGRGFC